jgi:hypothetical protein
VPDVQVDFDLITGAPKWITGTGLLTAAAPNTLATAAGADGATSSQAYAATKTFVLDHSALFGFGPEALDAAVIKREFPTAHNGLRTVVWEQQFDGVPLFEGLFISHTTKNGQLVNVSSQFLPDLAGAADRGTPNRAALLNTPIVSAARAVAIAAENVGEKAQEQDFMPAETPPSEPLAPGVKPRLQFQGASVLGPAEVQFVWLPMRKDNLRLCWEVVFTSKTRSEMFRVLVDAQSGEPLLRHCLTDYITDATYRVYLSDSPSPFSPGHPTLLTNQPPFVSRVLVVTNAFNTNASPNGWIDDGVNETRGNNVDAHTDRNADNVADLPRPQGSPFRVFDFPLDFAQPPSENTNAAVTQLFFLCNWYHDRLYELGFTEAAGNFQNNNFGRGGIGNDAVQADAQDGSGINNANFSSPSDGSPGRMQMYVWSGPAPDRDGDFDADIVFHEHTHGLSNRRVGGGVGISALQSAGMGEGWSDFYALSLLSQAGDDLNGNYAAAGYSTYLLSGLTNNYYFGIRRYPYTTDMTKDPLTFRDIDSAQASPHTGIPRSPVIGNTASEVHNQGQVWCSTLWEARAALVDKLGFPAGNDLMLKLVTDGMNLSPANPNFLQARNAIIQADVVDTGGANTNLLWVAFAKRGMGFGATSPSSSTTSGVLESFDTPDAFRINPGVGFIAGGAVGGPFTPVGFNFAVSNAGITSLNWSLVNTSAWLTVSPAGGTLLPGASSPVVASINGAASGLPLGVYSSSLLFSNQTSQITQNRQVGLNVVDPLRVTPAAGFIAGGPVGGPFTNSSLILVVSNAGLTSFDWNANNSAPWLNVSPAGGTLAGGASISVTATLTATANTLPLGVYFAPVLFSNHVSQISQLVGFTLKAGQLDYFTQLFDSEANNLDFQTFTFTPDGSANFYSACRVAATNFPTDPAGGTTVPLTDDSFFQVSLSGTNTVSLYGQRRNTFFIGSNGYLTFDTGDTTVLETVADHFRLPRISALFDDLNPETGGSISWKELGDHVAVTYQNIPEYLSTGANSFQMELFFDGRLRLTWLAISAVDGLAGLSAGNGTPFGFVETVLNSYATCSSLPPAPLLSSPISSGGTFVFTVTGGPGVPYVVESSTNLVNWLPIRTNLSPFAVTNIVDLPVRFFRARY